MPTQTQIAQHLDLSTRMVRELMAENALPRGGSLDVCRVAYIRRLREKAAGREREVIPDENTTALDIERTRLTKAQADERELIVERLKRTLIPAADVERVWGDMLASMRAKLIGIPSKAATQVIAAADRLEAENILRTMIYEALAELSEYREEDYDPGSGAEDTEDTGTTSQPDGDGLGGCVPEAKPRRQRRTRAVQQRESAVPTGDNGRSKRSTGKGSSSKVKRPSRKDVNP